MATIRWYLVNGVDANGWQALSTTAQGAATCSAGWVVGTGATLHAELQANTERASTTFVGTTVPDGTLDTSLKDAFRTPILNGTFASANWTLQFAVVSTVQAGAADGQIVFRLIKADADGSGATEITSAQQSASVMTNVGATDINGTLTFNPGAITFTNQYLFIQIAWKRTGAGGMTTTNIRLRTGSSATVGTTGLTADFTPVSQAVTGTTITSGSIVWSETLLLDQLGADGSTALSLAGRNRAQTISGVSGLLTSVSLQLQLDSVNRPTDALYLEIRGGTFNGPVLATSPQQTADTLAASWAWFNFPLPGGVVLAAGTTYWIELYLTRPSFDGTKAWAVRSDSDNAYSNGAWYDSSGTLVGGGTWDATFRLYAGASHAVALTGPDQAVTTNTIPATSLARAPSSIAVGAVTVLAATLATAAQLFPPAVAAVVGPDQVVTLAFIPPTGGAAASSLLQEDGSYLLQEDGTSRLLLDGEADAAAGLLYPPTVVPAGPPQAITTGPLAATAQLYSPSLTVGAVSITTPGRPTTEQLFAPSVAAGPVTVTTAHRPTTAQVFAPSVALGAVSITTPGRPTTAVLFPPSLTVGSVTITTGPRPTTATLFPPSLAAGPVAVTTTPIAATATVYPPSLTVGAVTVVTPGRPTTATLFPPALTVGAVSIITPPLGPLAQLYPPTVLPTGVFAGPHAPSTLQLFPPSVALAVQLVTTGPIGSTATLFPPSVTTGAAAITTGTIASTAQLYPPSLTVGATTITAGHIASTAQLFPPSLLGVAFVTTGTIGSTVSLFPPSVFVPLPTGITTGTIASAVVVYPPSLTVGGTTVVTAHIGSTATLFPPSLTTGATTIVTAPLGPLAVVYPPTLNVPRFAVAVTQLATEAFTTTPAATRATQLVVELFFPRPVETRVTQAVVEVFVAGPAITAVTSAVVELFILPGAPPSNACPMPLPIDPADDGGSCPPAFFDPDLEDDWA